MDENILAEFLKEEYKPLKSLEEARQFDNSYLVLVGDDGGQSYLTIPVRLVKINQDEISRLHKALDTLCWFCNDDTTMIHCYFEIRKLNSSGGGGMGGHLYLDKLWVHKELEGIYVNIFNIITTSY
jgi:hypothetical protein